jgi:two-component system, OmpR family, response regulator
MRILIAEDDQVLADGLLRSLRAAGAAVDHVATGSEADAALMTNNEFDLLILDLGLPRLHGLEVLKRLRSRGSVLPVLILTAADSVEERVKGLDYGADDYMAKPFSLQELEARVRALTRRGMGGTTNTIKHGPLEYDQAGRVATIDGKMVELSARELGLLEVLLQRAGRLVSKDQLVERLCEWGEEVSNNAIEVYIHRLRKKIEKGPIRIATVRGLGYCLEKISARGPAAGRSAQHRGRTTLRPDVLRAVPARAAQPVRRNPRLDAHAAAVAVAALPGADLVCGPGHCQQAV